MSVTNVTVLDNPARFDNPFQVSATTAFAAADTAPSPSHLRRPCVGDFSARSPAAVWPILVLLASKRSARVYFAEPHGCMLAAWVWSVCRRADPQFEVSFECLAPIADDIEWKVRACHAHNPRDPEGPSSRSMARLLLTMSSHCFAAAHSSSSWWWWCCLLRS